MSAFNVGYPPYIYVAIHACFESIILYCAFIPILGLVCFKRFVDQFLDKFTVGYIFIETISSKVHA